MDLNKVSMLHVMSQGYLNGKKIIEFGRSGYTVRYSRKGSSVTHGCGIHQFATSVKNDSIVYNYTAELLKKENGIETVEDTCEYTLIVKREPEKLLCIPKHNKKEKIKLLCVVERENTEKFCLRHILSYKNVNINNLLKDSKRII